MRFLIILFLFFSVKLSAQVELWQLEYSPDSTYFIGAMSDGEPTWRQISSLDSFYLDSLYLTDNDSFIRLKNGFGEVPVYKILNEDSIYVNFTGDTIFMKEANGFVKLPFYDWSYINKDVFWDSNGSTTIHQNKLVPNVDTISTIKVLATDGAFGYDWYYLDSIYTPTGGGSGTVTGNGVANKVTLWASTDSLTYDSLYFNSTNHILGLGTNSPTATGGSFGHQIHGGSFSSLRLTNSTTGATSTDGTSIYSYADSLYLSNLENGIVSIATNSVERGRFDSNGFKVDALKSGTTAPTTSGTLVKVVTDANGRFSFQTNNSGTVTSVGLTTGTSGTDVNVSGSPITTSGNITLNLPSSSASNRGLLTAANWTTFNNKFDLPALTSGSVLFSNGTTIAQNNSNFFWNNSQEQLGIGTNTPNSYILDGYNGLGIYDATSARIGMANSSRTWIQYLSGNEFRIYNSSSGESFAIESGAKWRGNAYVSSGTNKAAYFDTNGTLQRGDYDVLDGVGSGGYVARWFDANTQSTGGLYFPVEAGSQMALGTTSPSTYLQNGTSKGLAIHDAGGDPRLSLSNSTRHWVYYMSGNDLGLWNNNSSDLIRFDDAGRVGILNTSPQRTLHVTGEVRITDLVTDTPTLIMGADSDGDLTSIYTGTGLLLSGNTLSVNGVGTVTSIATNNGITGGTITTSGTVGLTGQALAVHNLSSNGLIARTGSGTVAARTIENGQGVLVTNGDGVSGNPSLFNVVCSHGQLYNTGNLTGQTLDGTYREIDFTSKLESNMTLSTTGNSITIPQTGTYEITYTFTYNLNASGTNTIYFNLYQDGADYGYNGETRSRSTTASTSDEITLVHRSFIAEFTASDVLEMYYQLQAGSATTISFYNLNFTAKRLK